MDLVVAEALAAGGKRPPCGWMVRFPQVPAAALNMPAMHIVDMCALVRMAAVFAINPSVLQAACVHLFPLVPGCRLVELAGFHPDYSCEISIIGWPRISSAPFQLLLAPYNIKMAPLMTSQGRDITKACPLNIA